MPTLSRSIAISRPTNEVFSLITDPHRVSRLIPGFIDPPEVELPLRRGSTFRWSFVLLGMRFNGMCTVDELQAPVLYSVKTTGGINSLWTYTLKSGGHETHLTLEITYEPPDSLLKQFALTLVRPHTDTLAINYLTNIKHFMESGVSPKSGTA